jgi:hypothetical protein
MADSDAIPLARLGNFRFATEEQIQRGIDAAMRDVISHDAKWNPNQVTREGLVTPVGAGVVSNGVALAPQENVPGETNGVPNNWGYQADAPKGPPGGVTAQRLIERMTPAFDTPQAQLAAMSVAQLDGLLAEAKRRPKSKEMDQLMAMVEKQLERSRKSLK